MASRKEKGKLLQKYWNIPDRQIETSAMLLRRGVKIARREALGIT